MSWQNTCILRKSKISLLLRPLVLLGQIQLLLCKGFARIRAPAKTPSLTPITLVKLFLYSRVLVILQGMVQTSIWNSIRSATVSLVSVLMLLIELPMIFGFDLQTNRSYTPKSTVSKEFCSGINFWTCKVFQLPLAFRTSPKLLRIRI